MEMEYKRILVAVDGSKEGDWAFRKAVEIAKRNNGKLYIVHVIDTARYRGIERYDLHFGERAKKHADELLAKYSGLAKEEGIVEVEMLLETGSPKVAITKHAEKKAGADLIVCGATGLNAVERILLGSVSEHVARQAKCDVLIVRSEKD